MFLKPDQLHEETCLEVWSFSSFSWLVGWLVDWSIVQLVNSLVPWLGHCSVSWLVSWLISCLVSRSIGHSVSQSGKQAGTHATDNHLTIYSSWNIDYIITKDGRIVKQHTLLLSRK